MQTGGPACGAHSRVKIAAVGDVSLSQRIAQSEYFSATNPEFQLLRAALNSSDLLIANFEFPFTRKLQPGVMGARKEISSSLEARRILDGIRWSVLTTATNHILDWGLEGIRTTQEVLSTYAPAVIGSGANRAEAARGGIVEARGARFGVLSYAKRGHFSAGEDSPGANPLDVDRACAEIRSTLSTGVDHVIVTLHWGVEFSAYPDPADVLIARRLVDAGADLVLGHHPHTLQGIEKYGRGLIAYSLGNFITDTNLDRAPEPEAYVKGHWGGILEVEMGSDGVVAYRLVPTLINEDMETRLATGADADMILRHLSTISADIGSQKFYASAFGNIYRRELVAWGAWFKKYGFLAIPMFLKRLKLRHFRMLGWYVLSRLGFRKK